MTNTQRAKAQLSVGERIQNVFLKVASTIHVSMYRLSGGKLGKTMSGVPILLLATTGRKTGKRRITPLMYIRDGKNVILVASKGGAPKDPVWWLNLKANPLTKIQIGDTLMTVRAHKADPEERARLWPQATKVYRYAELQKMTEREIPVVVLEPA